MAGRARIVEWTSGHDAFQARGMWLRATLARATEREIESWYGIAWDVDEWLDAELARRARLEDEDGE